jgi:hypothetical protein
MTFCENVSITFIPSTDNSRHGPPQANEEVINAGLEVCVAALVRFRSLPSGASQIRQWARGNSSGESEGRPTALRTALPPYDLCAARQRKNVGTPQQAYFRP